MSATSALLFASLLLTSRCYAFPTTSAGLVNSTSASSASTLVVTATTGASQVVTYKASRVSDTVLWRLTSATTATLSHASSTETIYPSGFEWAPPSSLSSGALPPIPPDAPYAYVPNWNPSSLTNPSATLSTSDSSSLPTAPSTPGQTPSAANGTSTTGPAASASGLPLPPHNHSLPWPWLHPSSATSATGTGLPSPVLPNGTVPISSGGPRSTPSLPTGSNSTSVAGGTAASSVSSGVISIISSIISISANSTTDPSRNSTRTSGPSSTTTTTTTTTSGQSSSGSSGSTTSTDPSGSITGKPTPTPTKPWGVETTTLSGSTWTLTFESTTATASTSFVESNSSTTTTVQVKSGDPMWSVPTPPAGFPLPFIPPPLVPPPPVAPVPGVPPPCVFGCGGGGGGSGGGGSGNPSPSSPGSSTGSSTGSSSSTSSSSTESCSSSSAVSSCMVTVSLSTSFLSGGTSSSTVATNTTTSCTTVTACTPTTATTTVSTSASGSGAYCSPGCAQCEAPVQTGAARRSSGAEELLHRDVPDSRTTFNVEAIYRKIESRISSGQTVNLKHGLTGILSTASIIDFAGAPKNLMVSGLVGCTSIAVVSRKGAWLSHIYESPTFLGTQAQFQQQALDPLKNGGKDFASLNGQIGGGGLFSDLSQTKVFIMTPGNGGSPLYGDFVNQLRDAISGSGGPLSGVSIAQHLYTKPSDETALPNDYDGKALIMYDNNQVNEPNQPKGSNPVPLPKPQAIWQVYMEDQRMDQDMWDPTSGQGCSGNEKRQDGGACTSAPTSGTTATTATGTGPVTTTTTSTNSSTVESAVGSAVESIIAAASSIASAQSAWSSSASAASSSASAASSASSVASVAASAITSVASAIPLATPLPPDCIGFDTGVSTLFQVFGVTWDNDKGDSLHKQEKGCGALTSWSYDADCQGGAGIAWFELPYFMKSGCVERAIHSSGGPEGLHCGQGGDIDNIPNAAAPCFLPTRPLPPPPAVANMRRSWVIDGDQDGNVTIGSP